MPYRWTPDLNTSLTSGHASDAETAQSAKAYRGEAPLMRLEIWPHRSLPNTGFAATIWLMFAAGCLPLLSFMGTRVFWVLLACLLAALAGLWIGLRRSDRVHLREEVLIWPDRLELAHWDHRNTKQNWQANPYWLRLELHTDAGPVEDYLTLKDCGPKASRLDGRTVELAAFLSPPERVQLKRELESVLRSLS